MKVVKFETEHKVRFGEVDGANIVFYPRYFEMISAAVEDWFSGPLEYPFDKMHVEDKAGIPLAKIECNFHAPSRLGDLLKFQLGVVSVGKSSVSLRIEVSANGEKRLAANLTFVFVSTVSGQITSKPVSKDLRNKMLVFSERSDVVTLTEE